MSRSRPPCASVLVLTAILLTAPRGVDAATWESIPLPGGVSLLRCALGVPAHVTDERLIGEHWRRALALDIGGPHLADTTTFAAWLTGVDRATDGRPHEAVSLAEAEGRRTRARLASALETAGLSLRSRSGRHAVEALPLAPGDIRARVNGCLDRDPLALAGTLNAGGSLALLPEPGAIGAPLGLASWRMLLREPGLTGADLVALLLTDPNVGVLHTALADLPLETLAVVRNDADLLSRLLQMPGRFALMADALRIEDARVRTPGGPALVDGWRRLTGRGPDGPARFLRDLLGRDRGAVALLYATVARFDTMGLAPVRTPDELIRLYDIVISMPRNWDPDIRPLTRPEPDPQRALPALATLMPPQPSGRRFWEAVLRGRRLPDDPQAAREGPEADFVWLAGLIASAPGGWEQSLSAVAHAARLAGAGTGVAAHRIVEAMAGFQRFTSLGDVFDRMPSISIDTMTRGYARAERLSGGEERAPLAVLQWQGLLASIHLAHERGSLDAAQSQVMTARLFDVEPDGRGFGGRLIRVADDLGRAMPPSSGSLDERWLGALLGPGDDSTALVSLEGLRFAVRVRHAWHQRALAVRAAQRLPTLDDTIRLGVEALALDEARTAADVKRVADVLDELRPRVGVTLVPFVGRQEPTDLGSLIEEEIRTLRRITNDGQASRATRSVGMLMWIAEELFARSLLGLLYAVELGAGIEAGPAVADLWGQHDAGFGGATDETRRVLRWQSPRRTGGRAVTGAVLGLAGALAEQAYRRFPGSPAPVAPILRERDRMELALLLTRIRDGDRHPAEAPGRPRTAFSLIVDLGLALNERLRQFLDSRSLPASLLAPLAALAYPALLDEPAFWHPDDRTAGLAFISGLSDARLDEWLFSLVASGELAAPEGVLR